MLQRILAPTDGSSASEKALPFAEQIARAHGAEVILTFILDQAAGAGRESAEQEARAHVEALEARLQAAGVRTRGLVERGPIAATLLDRERAEQPDLLVIATHGRTGLARFALGSVADRMVREGTAPVLVVRRSAEPTTELRSALVLLDGSAFSEGGLAMAEELAGRPLQSLTLFRVVADLADRGEAERYLQGVARRFTGSGIPVATAVEVGDTRHVIERTARGHDLVVLSTHGRGGFDRLRHGSLADYLTRYLDQPALMVRARDLPEHTARGTAEPPPSSVVEANLF